MIVRMGLLQKQHDLSVAEFRRHWREHHAGVAGRLPGLRWYEQNHVVESAQRGIGYKRGRMEYDGISQLWFDSIESMVEAIDTQRQNLVTDEATFISHLDIIAAEPTTVLSPPVDEPVLKRMSTLKRRADLSPDEFANEWRRHADFVQSMPGVRGYAQHLVVARSRGKDRDTGKLDASYDEIPIDGIVELWFNDMESLDHSFSTREGQSTMEHATSFIDEITAYLVEPVRIR